MDNVPWGAGKYQGLSMQSDVCCQVLEGTLSSIGYQPQVPVPPLKGPTTSLVIHPP